MESRFRALNAQADLSTAVSYNRGPFFCHASSHGTSETIGLYSIIFLNRREEIEGGEQHLSSLVRPVLVFSHFFVLFVKRVTTTT